VGETGARIDSFAQVPDATSEFAAQNLGGPIFATHALLAVARWRRALSTVFVDISFNPLVLQSPNIRTAWPLTDLS
jgi:hypothetical protein